MISFEYKKQEKPMTREFLLLSVASDLKIRSEHNTRTTEGQWMVS